MSPEVKHLPDAWIGRIFDCFTANYGTRFLDMWRGTDLAMVRRHWAEKLGGFHDKPQAIKAALDALDEKPFPPTLPEFLAMCRECSKRINTEPLALEHKLTPEDIERNRKRIAEIAAGLAKAKAIPE